MLPEITQALGLFIQCATCITIIYGAYKFSRKPNESLNERMDKAEERLNEIDKHLESGKEHFSQIDEGNRYTQEAILALLEHEIDGNNTAKLKQAKDNLQAYLIRK